MTPRKSMQPEERAGYNPKNFPVFCGRVRERREKLNMTQQQFGDLVGMRKQEVSTLEGGKFPRNNRRIVAIADALDVSLDWLFGRE